MRVLKALNIVCGKTLILGVRVYQAVVSPILPPVCRFRPTCSQYMIEAVRRKGFAVGFPMGVWRLLRCNPFFPGGYDPVR